MMSDQTTTRLAEIRARLDAATPGPWARFGRNSHNEDGDDWFLGHDIEGPPAAERGQFERVADAELIANAPADLEHLLSQLDAVRELHRPGERIAGGVSPTTRHYGCVTCRTDEECPTSRALRGGGEPE